MNHTITDENGLHHYGNGHQVNDNDRYHSKENANEYWIQQQPSDRTNHNKKNEDYRKNVIKTQVKRN